MRRSLVVLLVAMTAALTMLAGAWACSGQPQVFSVTPLTAAAGTQVSMRGQTVAATSGVELRWNGVNGPRLAGVTAGEDRTFTLTFTVPEAEPGVYSLILVADDADAVGRTTFEVSGAAVRSVRADSGFASAVDPVALDAPVEAASSTMLTAGVGLLAVGAVALFAGFGVATVRRRRAPAHRSLR